MDTATSTPHDSLNSHSLFGWLIRATTRGTPYSVLASSDTTRLTLSSPVAAITTLQRSRAASSSEETSHASASSHSALVEEAVSVGDLVRLMTFRQSEASLVELTMPADAPLAGQRIGGIEWPADTALVAILRDGRVIVPNSDDPLEAGDELLFVTSEDVEEELGALLSGGR